MEGTKADHFSSNAQIQQQDLGFHNKTPLITSSESASPDAITNAVKPIDLDDSFVSAPVIADQEIETRFDRNLGQSGTQNKGAKKVRAGKKVIKWWESGDDEENAHVEAQDSGSEKSTVGKEQINEGVNGDADGDIKHRYPLRLDAENCSHYMRTGTCKYGLNCRFNHPFGRRSQGNKDIANQREEEADRLRQVECKYYLTSGGCKHGNACRYNHGKAKTTAVPILELNYLGLPLRNGEKDCPYYMHTRSCKYGPNCRFNHPDPRSVVEGDPLTRHDNLQEAASFWWSSAGSFNGTAFVPPMYLSTVGASSNVEWDGYQGPIYTPSRMSLCLPPAVSHQSSTANFYLQHQQEMLVEETLEQNEQPQPPNPRTQSPPIRPCPLNENGLPLRPDKDICAYYNRYRICKHGRACRFDHPGNVAQAAR